MRIYDYEAFVDIDGQPLAEYDLTFSRDGMHASCWVASEEGKPFQVRWKDCHRDRQATRGYLRVDGILLPGATFIPPSAGPYRATKYQASRSRLRASEDEFRCLKFSSIELTDDDAAALNEPSERLGEITLEIYDVRIVPASPPRGGARRPRPSRTFSVPIPEDTRLHETSKKAGGHRIQLGETQRDWSQRSRSSPQSFSNRLINISREPTFTFTFRYRPLDILKASGVAPQSAQPRITSRSTHRASSLPIKEDPDAYYVDARQESIDQVEEKLRYHSTTPWIGDLPITHEFLLDDDGVYVEREIIDLT